MQRDLDLIRQILLALEQDPAARRNASLEIPEVDAERVAYHIKLLAQAGFVEAIDASTREELDWQPISLTWQGHEFLADAKNEGIWNEAKAKVSTHLGSISVATLQALLISLGKTVLGLP